MPTIKFSFKDLKELLGKSLTVEQLKDCLSYCKAELDDYDKSADELTISVGDTNLPYLWSVEGISRLLKGVLGIEKGIPSLAVKQGNYKVMVEKSVAGIRPYICAFVARGKKVDDYLLKQMIQLQEKLCENYGRKRKNIAIGVYSYKQIKFPVHYKATDPESVRFVPLDYRREMTQQEILDEHPKGKEYAWILEGEKKYPILVDDNNVVLSFPPIINSAKTGKIEPGEQDLFFEATGNDLNALITATNIFAYALSDRGFDIYSVDVDYGTKKIKTPVLKEDKIKINIDDVDKLLGLDINATDVKKFLEKARYDFAGNVAAIPPYRADILHPVDVIEDIAIMYGYQNIAGLKLESYTSGSTFPLTRFVNRVREIVIGLGYQEVFSPILINKQILYENMNLRDFGTVEIANPVSATYSCVRSWLLPVMMDFLSKNKHAEYPQKIFEQGLITAIKKDKSDKTSKEDIAVDYERLALAIASNEANYTEARQCLDAIMNSFSIKYMITAADHESFIPGRVARVAVNGINIAFIGELSPKVIKNFDLNVPVVGFELNLSDLFEAISK